MKKNDRNKGLFCSAKKIIGDYFKLRQKIDQSICVEDYYYIGDKRYSLDTLIKARRKAILSARKCSTQRKCYAKGCVAFSGYNF